jgi:ankyrin repeat protein
MDLGATPLHFAANQGYIGCTEQLLKAKANPAAQLSDGVMSTPLMLAAKHGHAGVVTALLNAGAGDEILAAEHALLLACIRGHKETVWRLLKKVPDANTTIDPKLPPPLIAAAARGHDQVVELLIRNFADVDVRDRNGVTAAEAARFAGETEQFALGNDEVHEKFELCASILLAASRERAAVRKVVMRTGGPAEKEEIWVLQQGAD